jgi:hypothetical protein
MITRDADDNTTHTVIFNHYVGMDYSNRRAYDLTRLRYSMVINRLLLKTRSIAMHTALVDGVAITTLRFLLNKKMLQP